MELQYLRLFHEAAKTGSFSAAAKSLKITQPSISRGIQALEHSLGVKLFIRAARGVQLTDEGRRVFERSEKVFNECDAIEKSKSSAVKPLRAAASDNLCIHVLPKALEKVSASRLISGTAEEVIRAVMTGDADLGYCYHPSKTPGLSCVAIATVDFWIVVHPSLVGRSPTARSLKGLPLIGSLSRDYQGPNAAQTLLAESGVERAEPKHQCNNQEAQLAMVGARLGYSLLPWFIAAKQVEDGGLVRIKTSRTLRNPLFRITKLGFAPVDGKLDLAIKELVERR